MKKNETGSVSIEALISITFFMIAILVIMFMSVIIKVQAQMQYAIGQTAKEISGYYYLLDKIGLTSVTSGVPTGDTQKNLENIDGTIKNIVQFSCDAKETIDDVSSIDLSSISIEKVKEIAEKGNADKDTFQKDLNAIKTSLGKINNPKEQFQAVLNVFGKSMINKSFSYFVAPIVCEALTQKYLTSGDIKDYCKSSGLVQDSIDFSGSQLLLDGRSIKIDVVYTLNTKPLTFGMIDQNFTFHQVASTAAWVRPNETGSIKSIKDLNVIAE